MPVSATKAAALSLIGGAALGAVACFVFGIFGLVRAQQEASAVPREGSILADITRTYGSGTTSAGNQHGRYRCAYSFFIGASIYHGAGCPDEGFDDSISGLLRDAAGQAQQLRATVYYDSNDPSFNTATEFSVLSRRDARVGWIFIRLGGMILLFVAIGAVLALKSTSAPAVGPEGTLSFTASAASVTEPEQSTPENQKFLDDLRRQLRGESEPGE